MKDSITITSVNIHFFSPYQGNENKLKIGDVVLLAKSKIPCVRQIKGQKSTFSIYTHTIADRYKKEEHKETFMFDRY